MSYMQYDFEEIIARQHKLYIMFDNMAQFYVALFFLTIN